MATKEGAGIREERVSCHSRDGMAVAHSLLFHRKKTERGVYTTGLRKAQDIPTSAKTLI
jgi:hypothetical protein